MTALALRVTEEQFQAQVIELAKGYGWLVHHSRPSLDPRKDGQWRTTIDGDKGYPDLALARGGRHLLVELKSDVGRLSKDQLGWLEALGYPHSPNVFVWRPVDMAEVIQTLRRGA